MLTEFGKAVRKARIDVGTSMLKMAESLGVKPSFVSQIETGKKNIPADFVAKAEKFFAGFGLTIHLGQLADAANKTVSLEGLDTEMQFLVSGFARSTLTEEQIGRLKQMLDEAEAKEAYGRNGKK